MARSSYSRQFKKGTYPQEHWDESVRVNGHEPDSPSASRKRKSLGRGTQVEANPGLVGKNDFKRRR